jgi:hypothetical protein
MGILWIVFIGFVAGIIGKRPADRAYRLIFARENVRPLTGKLRGTYVDGNGAFGS